MAKVLFLYPNLRAESLIPPCITLLSRLLKDRGHTVDLFDSTNYDIPLEFHRVDTDKMKEQNLNVRPTDSWKRERKKGDVFHDFESKVEEFSPDLIAVTVTEATFMVGITLMKSIKQYDIRNIWGGVFPTFAPMRAIGFPEVEMLCVGEGENCLTDLCELIDKKQDYSKVTNLWFKKPGGEIIKNAITKPVDINELPTNLDVGLFLEREPDRSIRPMGGKLYRMLPVETHRGCPYTCAFCNSPSQNVLYAEQTQSSFFRKKRVDRIRQELLYYRDNWGVQYNFMWADTFFAWTPQEMAEFAEMYQDIKLPFWCQTRPETVKRDILEMLKGVGLDRISYGIEHGNLKFRREVVNRRYPDEVIAQAGNITRELSIPFNGNNIIGYPTETRALSFETIELNRKIPTDTMSCSIFQPYYGTPLRDLAVKHGFMDKDFICPSNSDDTVLKMPGYSSEEIRGLRRCFAMYTRFPKDRWPEIKEAEKMTPEGDKKWEALRDEFMETFYGKKPESEF
ncbi:MAG: B12-binding domain-containing radical SAM protein [Elusimicrobia bacterium]|nr:B12-binding domain-containing radical SAM protein [Elusimicrobiota bacterium]